MVIDNVISLLLFFLNNGDKNINSRTKKNSIDNVNNNNNFDKIPGNMGDKGNKK